MDDDEFPNPDPELAFDLTAVKAALQAKTLKGDCPICGENHWSVPDGTALIRGATRPDGTFDDELGMIVISVICVNCGYIRLHHLNQLMHEEDASG